MSRKVILTFTGKFHYETIAYNFLKQYYPDFITKPILLHVQAKDIYVLLGNHIMINYLMLQKKVFIYKEVL